jgi:pimeloyl-ACP methyl ester carboxylesterase
MIWYGLLIAIVGLTWWDYRRNRRRLDAQKARRKAVWSGARMFTLYLGVLGLLLWFENNLVYHPQSDKEFWQPPPNLVKEDVQFQSKLDDRLHGWWCPQKEAKWTILFSHGNAGNLSGHAWIIPALRAQIVANVFIYDYPGYGKSSGKPSEKSCYSSADAAYEWLTNTKKIPADQIILMGQSIGSGMACELATEPHRAMVLHCPFTAICDLGQEIFPIFPVKWLMGHRYDNVSKLKNYTKPILIGHGDNDDIIPFHHGERLFAGIPSKEKVFYRIENGHHGEMTDGFLQTMKKFLDDLDKPETPANK